MGEIFKICPQSPLLDSSSSTRGLASRARRIAGFCHFLCVESMNVDDGAGTVEISAEGALAVPEEEPIMGPHVGMEFESEEDAKVFHDDFARRLGFVMRVMSCRRSEVDGRILARRLGCNKEGFCVSIQGKSGPLRKLRPSSREGCKAMILVKSQKSGKWVVTKFIRDHNHPLVVSSHDVRHTIDEKDRKIQELTMELRNKKRICAVYQGLLTAFVKEVEDHCEQISKKVEVVVNNIKRHESKDWEVLHQR